MLSPSRRDMALCNDFSACERSSSVTIFFLVATAGGLWWWLDDLLYWLLERAAVVGGELSGTVVNAVDAAG